MTVIEQALAVPFRILPNGSVETTIDQKKIWNDRVVSVLGTAWGERVRRYEFGSKIFEEVFAQVGDAEMGIERAVETAFVSYLPLLTLKSVTSNYDQTNNTLNVTVFYTLPNEISVQSTIGTVNIDGMTPPKEF